MREIRAWDDVENKMLHGTVEQYDDMLAFRFDEHFETEKPIYMWSTGLHDDVEDGNKLYQDDIVAVTWADKKHICKIEFSAGTFMFVADSLPDGYLPLHELAEYDCGYGWVEGAERLGDIYTNPELLGG